MPEVEAHLDGQIVSSTSFEGARLVIGRGAGAALRLPERDVSRQHAALLRRDNLVLIMDLGSRYGTFVNGERIPFDNPRPLSPGDTVQLGEYRLEITGLQPTDLLVEAEPSDVARESLLEIESETAAPVETTVSPDDDYEEPESDPAPRGWLASVLLLLFLVGLSGGMIYAFFAYFRLDY